MVAVVAAVADVASVVSASTAITIVVTGNTALATALSMRLNLVFSLLPLNYYRCSCGRSAAGAWQEPPGNHGASYAETRQGDGYETANRENTCNGMCCNGRKLGPRPPLLEQFM